MLHSYGVTTLRKSKSSGIFSYDRFIDADEIRRPQGEVEVLNVDALAEEIRRVDGANTLGAARLAEALMPTILAGSVRSAPADAAVAAIAFSLHAEEGAAYLRAWNEGDFDVCRAEWPEAPEECYVGADPLHPGTKALIAEAEVAASDELLLKEALAAIENHKSREFESDPPALEAVRKRLATRFSGALPAAAGT